MRLAIRINRTHAAVLSKACQTKISSHPLTLKTYTRAMKKAQSRRTYLRNRGKVIAAGRAWRLANPEKHRASARKSYHKHKSAIPT